MVEASPEREALGERAAEPRSKTSPPRLMPRHLRYSVRLGRFCYALRMESIFVPVRLYSLGQIVPLTGAPAKAGTKAICPRSLRLYEKPRLAGPPLPGETERSPEETMTGTLHPSGSTPSRHLP
jgi:hypothetical protein